jgi:DNA-binding HxlR family transcriptional regulator
VVHFWDHRAVPDYGRFCPVSLATDVLADKWTPLVVREMVLGNTRFNDIARALPGISRSLLVQRLHHLERKGVLQTWPSPAGRGKEYHLTPAGKDLERVLDAMGRWAVEWLYDEIHPGEVDPVTLTWWMHRRVDTGNLPTVRVVLELRHTAPDPQVIWMVLDRGEASVCIQHPGFETDVCLRTSTPALGEVFAGARTWQQALRSGELDVTGPSHLVKALPTWFLWSPWAEATRERGERV